ncbi:MAG: hypothetical protein ABI597_08175 [Gammaproteobacteria bacterium]
MNEITLQKSNGLLPLKSVAVALIFCAILGPVGLLYSSYVGGIVMILFGFIAMRMKLYGLVFLAWMISCIWGVGAANRYNKKILQ